jgi:hypothetical protein
MYNNPNSGVVMPIRELVDHQSDILLLAGNYYRNGGEERVDEPMQFTPAAGERTGDAYGNVRTAARFLYRMAELQDRIEAGGIVGKLAAFELGITRRVERWCVGDVLKAGGLVETIRKAGPENLPEPALPA